MTLQNTPLRFWLLTDKKTGTEIQARSLALELGIPFDEKSLTLAAPFRWGPAKLAARFIKQAYPSHPALWKEPAPDLVIAAGRRTVAASLYLKSRGSQVIFLQDPHIAPSSFDLVVAPDHDRLQGDNIIASLGALNRITPGQLMEAADRFRADFVTYRYPRIAVLIGGGNKYYRFGVKEARQLADNLAILQKRYQGSLLVTTSRRTGAAQTRILKERLKDPNIYFWDGAGENPYHAFLGLADYILVTPDSISMHSEAASTGRPIYTLKLKGRYGKFDLFHQSLQEKGISRIFEGTLESWKYEPLQEVTRIAGLVRKQWPDLFPDPALEAISALHPLGKGFLGLK